MDPELENCRFAPFWCKLGKRGGLCACLGVSASRTRVWAAGGVEINLQQINPNFQGSGNV
eukprot:1140010-Pelagomonas_calceolata.AAC.3